MPIKRRKTTVVEKEGLRFIQNVVEDANCIFHEIHKENDYGLDGILEFVENEVVLGTSLGIQLKSGRSYCSAKKCKIPASPGHFAYWSGHSLPVLGIVYDPDEKCAYWVNITSYLKDNLRIVNDGPFTINFEKSDISRFNKEFYQKVFLPLFLRKPLPLTFQEAQAWSQGTNYEKHCLGVGTLLYHFRNKRQSWDLFFRIFRKRAISETDPYLIYIFALVKGHPDIFWHKNNSLDDDIRDYAESKISSFTTRDMAKLFSFVDEESFSRGAIGQDVHAIFELIKNKEKKLFKILSETDITEEASKAALLLFAYYGRKEVLPKLRSLREEKFQQDSLIDLIISDLETHGEINFY